MIQELVAAGQHLNGALERYFNACTALQGCLAHGKQIDSMHRALSDRVVNELQMVDHLAFRLKQAKAAISNSRNYITTLVPINLLPSEILARIFRLVLDTQSCTNHKRVIFPKYPDLLSHVCSRWRQVALSSRTLWSHIDLAPCHPFHRGLLARAIVHAARAEHSPLTIHTLSFEPLGKFNDDIQGGLEQFLASIAAQIRGLELLAGGVPPADDVSSSILVLNSCISSCIPGKLTQLTIKNTSEEFPTLIRSRELDYDHDDQGTVASEVYLDQSYDFLEDLWRGITILRLHGLYPHWSSAAYHGLVELRLTFGINPHITVSEQHLVAILASSPRLRIFQLDNPPYDSCASDALATPVLLDKLEVLDVAFISAQVLGCLLRWITPGARPLRLSLTGNDYMLKELGGSDNAVAAFFARSNIYSLRLVYTEVSYTVLIKALGLVPNLQVLVLENSPWYEELDLLHRSEADRAHPAETQISTACLSISHLYLLHCRVHLDSLKRFLEKHLIQTLTIWQSDFFMAPPPAGQASREYKNELRTSCNAVELLDGDKPSQVGGWD